MSSAGTSHRQLIGDERPIGPVAVKREPPSTYWDDLQVMSYVQLLLIILIAICTAIYLLAPGQHTDAHCTSTYLYTIDCAPGNVLGEYILE
jgi:hypothetical protein